MSVTHALPRIPPVRRSVAKTQQTEGVASSYKARRAARKKKERIIFWSVLFAIGIMALVISGIGSSALQTAGVSTPQVKIGQPFTTYSGGNKYEVSVKDVVLLVNHDKRSGNPSKDDKLLVSYSFKNLGPRKGSITLNNGAVTTDKGHIYEINSRPANANQLGVDFKFTNGEIGETGVSAFYISIPKGSKLTELTFTTGDTSYEEGKKHLVKLPQKLPVWWEYHPNPPDSPEGVMFNLNVYNVEIIKDESYLKTRIAEDTDYSKAAERARINREKEIARIQEITRRAMRK